MNNKNKLLSVATFAAFSLLASPAMAQDGLGGGDNSGFGGPPSESNYTLPNEVDYGEKCSRRRPQECTPEEKERINRNNAITCAVAGGVLGAITGIVVGAAASTVTSPAGGAVAGRVAGGAATPAIVAACIESLRIP
jgi:hypothetical protein